MMPPIPFQTIIEPFRIHSCEWFEQALIETVLGAQALRGARHWSIDDMDALLSEQALTAAVLPRYHIDIAIKRALGARLGSVKDRAS
jgi:hypothetical protein